MPGRHFHRGELVIYRAAKCSSHPGPRAQLVDPAPQGELYSYEVEKFWIVLGEQPDGTVELMTRTGKIRHVSAEDTRLRPARWWERWWFRRRFPHLPGPRPEVTA